MNTPCQVDPARGWTQLMRTSGTLRPVRDALRRGSRPGADDAFWRRREPAGHGDRRFAASLAQDPRFAACQATCSSRAAGSVAAPLDERSKAQWGFALRQFIDAMSPANFLATNPEAIQLALDTGGASLVEGTRLFLEDLAKGRVSMTDEKAFEVGRNLATTPGSVVFENELMQLIQYAPTHRQGARAAAGDRAAVHQQVLHPRPAARELARRAMRWRRATRCSWSRGATSARPTATSTWDDYLEQGVLQALDVARRHPPRRPGQHARLLRRRHAARQRAGRRGGTRRATRWRA